MALKAYIETFNNYKQMLDDVEKMGLEDTAEITYEKLFSKLREVTGCFKADGLCSTVEGEKRHNSSKNRYKDILPYDHSRVKLKEVSNVPGSDYINANHIQGVTANQVYIAAQGPMPETVNDFWQMLWENNVKVVLMACNEFEGIPRKLRCQRYWALDSEERLEFGDITVCLLKEQKVNYDEYLVRHLRATRGGESRDLVHLHYTAWPDRGTPRCIPSILNMIDLMREFQSPYMADAPPVVVHCSAGCGRTGTILVLDYVWNMIKFGKLTASFSVYDIILEMRKQRMAIVQSLEQYVFVHEAIVELFAKQLELIDEHAYYDFNKDTVANRSLKSNVVNDTYEEVFIDDSKSNVALRPKPTPRLANQASVKSEKGDDQPTERRRVAVAPPTPNKPHPESVPSLGDVNTAIYAVPSRQPISANPSRSTKPSFKVNNSLDEVVPLQSAGRYSEVGEVTEFFTSPLQTPTPASRQIRLDSASEPVGAGSSEYAYADPDATGRWALQHIARNESVPDGTRGSPRYRGIYCEIGEYATVDVDTDTRRQRLSSDSSSEKSVTASPLTQRRVTESVTDRSGAFFSKLKLKIGSKTQQLSSSSEMSSSSSSIKPIKIIFRGEEIGYPNRVAHPKFGARQMECLNTSL